MSRDVQTDVIAQCNPTKDGGHLARCGRCFQRLWLIRRDQAAGLDEWDDYAKPFFDGAWRLLIADARSWRYDEASGVWYQSAEAELQRGRAMVRLSTGEADPYNRKDPRQVDTRERAELRERLRTNGFSDFHNTDTTGVLPQTHRLIKGRLGTAFDLPARVKCPSCHVVNRIEAPPSA